MSSSGHVAASTIHGIRKRSHLSELRPPCVCAVGACTLVPDLSALVVAISGSTDPDGRASISTPLPAVPGLVGAKLVEQWLVLTGGGCPLLGIDLSNAIEVEIQ